MIRSLTARGAAGGRGHGCQEVAGLLGDPVRTAQSWAKAFLDHGLAGREDKERNGRPRRLLDEQLGEVAAAIRLPPEHFGLSSNIWDGRTLSEHMREIFGIELGVGQYTTSCHDVQGSARGGERGARSSFPAATLLTSIRSSASGSLSGGRARTTACSPTSANCQAHRQAVRRVEERLGDIEAIMCNQLDDAYDQDAQGTICKASDPASSQSSYGLEGKWAK